MKTLFTILLIFVLVSSLVGNVFQSRQISKEQEYINVIEEFASKKYDEYESKIQFKEKEALSFSTLLVSEQIKNESLRKENNNLHQDIIDLKSKFMCPEKISWDVDYSNAGTVNKSLIKWVEEVSKVENSTYKPLWNDSKTSWHELRSLDTNGGYIAYFYLVFFDEDDFHQGIYSVALQCYIS